MKCTRLVLVSLSATAALLFGACSSDEAAAPPQATDGPDAAATPEPAKPNSPAASPTSEQDAAAGVDPADLPAGSGLVLATELDTNAPVDPSGLGGKLTAGQVQEMRRAWNERRVTLAAAEGSECTGFEGGVWIYVVEVSGAGEVLAFGASADGDAASCSFDEALVLVDAATLEVLGDDSVALLL